LPAANKIGDTYVSTVTVEDGILHIAAKPKRITGPRQCAEPSARSPLTTLNAAGAGLPTMAGRIRGGSMEMHMNMPFTAEQFFAVFERYNDAVWPAQPMLFGLALVALALIARGRAGDGRWVASILALLWAWMGIAYHLAFFTAINPAAWGFGALFLLGAIAFAWVGGVRGRLSFAWRADARGRLGGALVVFALLVYPAVGWLVGHRYPAVPTFGLPCPTTIFTIGVLLFARGEVPRTVLVVPLLWALVGSTAAFALAVYQDLGLLVAAGVAVAAATHRGVFGTAGAGTFRTT
jgi:hypothetical protein